MSLGLAGVSNGALVGHWAFDEASTGVATTVQDSTANNNDGTVNGGAMYVAGQIGTGALSFDGVDDYVRVIYPHTSVHPLDMAGSQYTMTWWAKTTAINNSALNVMIGNDDGYDYADGVLAYYNFSGVLEFAQNPHDGSPNQTWGTGYNVTSPIAPQYGGLGQWVHLAITYDDATNTRNFYVNGIHYNVTTVTAENAGSNQSTDLYFGRYTVNNSHYFNGALDDVRIYDEALTGAQIVEIMNVPEPTSAALLLAGLSVVAIRRRRQA